MKKNPKPEQEEWAFFLDGYDRMQYCEQCVPCTHACKQSFRIRRLYCPKCVTKRGIKNDR